MIGAIIGDIVGSRFEYDNIKIKDFELFTDDCHFTDDTVLTVAVAGRWQTKLFTITEERKSVVARSCKEVPHRRLWHTV